jgi:hypothetical protein
VPVSHPPTAPRVDAVVPQVAAPVLSNKINSGSFISITSDLGKSLLSLPDNIYKNKIIPCVAPVSVLSHPKPFVAPAPVLSHSNSKLSANASPFVLIKTPTKTALPVNISMPLATSDPSAGTPKNLYHKHPHAPDRLNALIEQLALRYDSSD